VAKLPAFQFYPGDWLKNADLARCSKGAKGMWIDMLAIAFDCEERGVFISRGVPWTDQEIAESISGDCALNLLLLKELIDKGVARRDSRGALYSPRMVRDELVRKAHSEAGKQGGRGNAKANQKQNESKTKAKRKQTPEDEDEEEDSNSKGGAGGIQPEDVYLAYPKHVGKGSALKAIRRALESRSAEFLLERVTAYAAAVSRWPKERRQYIPMPATWFNAERYEDDQREWEAPAQEAKPGYAQEGSDEWIQQQLKGWKP